MHPQFQDLADLVGTAFDRARAELDPLNRVAGPELGELRAQLRDALVENVNGLVAELLAQRHQGLVASHRGPGEPASPAELAKAWPALKVRFR